MPNYTQDADILKYRPELANYDLEYLDEYHTQATLEINQSLEAFWYRAAADDKGIDWQETEFDQDLLLNSDTQIKKLACYRVLYLIFASLANEVDGSYSALRDYYDKLYHNEFEEALKRGINYDWDKSGAIDADEKAKKSRKRLVRV